MYPMMGGGTQKIEMNKRTRGEVPSAEYEAMKRSMLKQNPAEAVVQDMRLQGAGSAMESARSPQYGNVNSPGLTQGMMQGEESMQYADSFNNAPLSKPTAQTGQLGFFSATQEPQKQPELMGQEAEQGIRQRVLGEPGGLNNREQLYRRGN
jgi:hypothetical protein